MDLFSWNKEISAIYSYIQTHRRSCSHKNRDQWTVIVLSFLRCVSFPVLHQLWQLFPWWKGRHHSICIVAVMVSQPRPLLSVRHCFVLHVFFIPHFQLNRMTWDSELMQMDAFVLQAGVGLSLLKPSTAPCFRELKMKWLPAQKRPLICWFVF